MGTHWGHGLLTRPLFLLVVQRGIAAQNGRSVLKGANDAGWACGAVSNYARNGGCLMEARLRHQVPQMAPHMSPPPGPTLGSHSSHFGRYQFQSPSSFMVAGC